MAIVLDEKTPEVACDVARKEEFSASGWHGSAFFSRCHVSRWAKRSIGTCKEQAGTFQRGVRREGEEC